MVLATNRAEDLDSAVLDRMDESLYLGLPDAHKRRSLTVTDTLTFALPFFFNDALTHLLITNRAGVWSVALAVQSFIKPSFPSSRIFFCTHLFRVTLSSLTS
jgi:AAA+ superfamily predicted ATPase